MGLSGGLAVLSMLSMKSEVKNARWLSSLLLYSNEEVVIMNRVDVEEQIVL